MNITTTKDGTALNVSLEGRLDTTTSPELISRLEMELPGAQQLVLDLKGLEYISSAGLRVLLTAQKKMSALKGMLIRNVNAEVMEVFEVTGFVDILNIEG